MTQELERQVIELIATDRIYMPISSMVGKLERRRPKLGKEIAKASEFEGSFGGDRVYARLESEYKMKARGMREGIEVFTANYPRYGAILNGMIEEQRAFKEKHLYFGTNPNTRLTQDDYMGVMGNLGFSQSESRTLYPSLMDISRKLSKQRGGEDRSVMVA